MNINGMILKCSIRKALTGVACIGHRVRKVRQFGFFYMLALYFAVYNNVRCSYLKGVSL